MANAVDHIASESFEQKCFGLGIRQRSRLKVEQLIEIEAA